MGSKRITTIFFLLISTVFFYSCSNEDSFILVKNGQFMRDNRPYYFVGTNFWYGPILASAGEGGDMTRLTKELDMLKEIGIDNLRVLVGSDGERGITSKVEPTLQVQPGAYNDTLLVGLDRFMVELQKRDMTAVLYLNNSWEWTGGYSQYLAWSGYGRAPVPAIDGWPAYTEYVAQYHKSDSARALFNNYVKDIITRTNSITNVPYVEDPTIFSWQIGNEPRAFGKDNKESFAVWIGEVAKLIKSLDPNHMVSIGSEGKAGSEDDITLWERITSYPEVDYANIHIWPYNWTWISKENMFDNIDIAKENTRLYLQEHLEIAEKLAKPVTLEEFGFPRDNFEFSLGSPTTLRDNYYKYIFSLLEKESAKGGVFAGCNFWGWGGFAKPSSEHIYWVKGDDYTGDPAQEEQGLNSVFAVDSSTVEIIKNANIALRQHDTSSK